MKQAAKVWNEKVDKILQRHGFIQGMADPCLYVKDTKDGKMYLIIYADDILIASKKEEDIIEIGEALGQFFKLTNLGTIHHYLGMEIERDQEGMFSIGQTRYIEKILKSFGLEDAKLSKIPLDAGYLKIEDDEPMDDNQEYRKLIGMLLYFFSVSTRPDIAASVSILSQCYTPCDRRE